SRSAGDARAAWAADFAEISSSYGKALQPHPAGKRGADQSLDPGGAARGGGGEAVAQRGAAALRLQMGGGDAGRALGHRRDRGQRDPDPGRDRARRRRRRYRLRHDGGRDHGRRRDRGAWGEIPQRQIGVWRQLERGYKAITEKYPRLDRGNDVNHLGTLGTGNHFIEVCLDENDRVWFMLHSGSRGVGNRIGTFFIELAKNDLREQLKNLPDKDLAYFKEGSEHFEDYVHAVAWAQEFAFYNRKLMMEQLVDAVAESGEVPRFSLTTTAVNCHHNYVAREQHYGRSVLVTRKGAVRAGKGDLGIIPGSM